MSVQILKKIYAFIFIILMLGFIYPLIACEPGGDLYIVNRTDQTLRIMSEDNFVGEIAPDTEIQTTYIMSRGFITPITATDSQGQIVYRKDFNGAELCAIGGRVIIPAENVSIGGPNRLAIYNEEPLLISILVNEQLVARIRPYTRFVFGYEAGETRYQIEIRNVNNQVIYSDNFTGDQLLGMKGQLHYKSSK